MNHAEAENENKSYIASCVPSRLRLIHSNTYRFAEYHEHLRQQESPPA